MLDADGVVVHCDDAVAEMTSRPDAVGLPYTELFGAASGPQEGEVELLVGDRILQLHTSRVSPSMVGAAWLCAVRDVTDSRRKSEQLSILVQTLTSLVEASPLAILTLDLDKNVHMWNPAAERIFGWRQEEVRGRPYPIVPSEEWSEFTKLFDRVIGGEGFAGVEARRRRKDGQMVDLSISTAPLCDANGNVNGAMAMFEDLTAKKNLEERYRHSQKMEAVGRLAGGVAHDFNNLLTVILGTCDLLRITASPNDAELLERLESIRHCGTRAAELTASLLAFSRRQLLQPRVLSLNALIERITSLLQRLIGEHIDVELQLHPELPPIFADSGQIEQVLVNLAVNAKDAMPSGGRLTVRTRRHEVTTEAPGSDALAPGEYVVLEVADTGHGIPHDVLPHVFDPFFTTKGTGQGTGLGLATVHGIAHQSGGTVEVESSPGQGARFLVYLPRSKRTELQAGPAGPRLDALPRGSETVVLVEDDEVVRRTATKMLESLGYTVIAFGDGASAIEHCATLDTIDLLLTDLRMYGMNGLEVAGQFARLRPGTPIVLMSGNLDDEPAARTLIEEGRTSFFGKPLRLDVMATKLRDIFDRRGQTPRRGSA